MKTYKHLSPTQRYQIAASHRSGISSQQIAVQLDRDPTTISENNAQHTNFTPEIIELVSPLLALQHSPEQVCGRLKLETGLCLSPMGLYRLIYADASASGALWTHMRSARVKPKSRKQRKTLRGCIKNRVSIHERDPIVDTLLTIPKLRDSRIFYPARIC